MKKTMMALGLAAALVLMLTACGGGAGKEKDSASAGSTDSASRPIIEEPLVKEVADDGLCHIGILTYRSHGAAEETIRGFEDEFRSMMGSTEVVFETMDADGDPEKCARIATGYANSGYKLIFAVGTEAVQNAGAAVKDVPIIGACVTDYLLAEVVSSLEAPGGNISGVSSLGPINLQIDQLTEALPWPTKVGIVASGTEVGSKFQVSIAAQCLAEKNIEWESYNGNTEETLRKVLEKAASECSCLYLPTDSFVASHMDIVKEVSLATKIPVITGDYHMCRGGGLFCYSIDYEKLGRKAASMAFDELEKGEEISRLAVREEELKDTQKYYNPEMAEALEWYSYGGMSPIVIASPEEEAQSGETQYGEAQNGDTQYGEENTDY